MFGIKENIQQLVKACVGPNRPALLVKNGLVQ